MSRVATAPKQRRRTALIWLLVLAAVIVALMIAEQIAILYVLATLGLTALLVVVALADLRGSQQQPATRLPPGDDSAAIGSGIRSSLARER